MESFRPLQFGLRDSFRDRLCAASLKTPAIRLRLFENGIIRERAKGSKSKPAEAPGKRPPDCRGSALAAEDGRQHRTLWFA